MTQYLSNFSQTTKLDPLFTDATDKLRVTNPQSLIDTDFEYGTQISKWENLTLINNRPFSYQRPEPLPFVEEMEMLPFDKRVKVVLSSGVAPPNGTPITVQDSFLAIANGNFIVEEGGGSDTFYYSGRVTNTNSLTQILDANKTAIYVGEHYNNAEIGTAPGMSYDGKRITVTTSIPHGLAIGNEIAVDGVTTDGTNPPNGAYVVATILSPTLFVFYAKLEPTGTLNTTNGKIYVRPQGQFLHRPFDGGVIFTSNTNANYERAVRQTRRYFRYQSGKSIQMSSGSILKPNLQVDLMTANGTTITVQTKEQHNIQPGARVRIQGANEPPYNGEFEITSILSYNKFQFETYLEPAKPVASGEYSVSVLEWYGASNRLGLFDDQNGMFFEFDGQNCNVVKRSSTFQIAGKVSVTQGSELVTQTEVSFPTVFSKQLLPGDMVVIRGQSYRVVAITDDQNMTITPSYRGASSDYVVMSKTIDERIPQEDWNIDTMDGNGPSGYDLDLSKMQMFYIDYTWYGAGYVRYGLRGIDGQVYYCHKILNNNVNYEAFMRSGNLPARYESSGEPPRSGLARTLGVNDTELFVDDHTVFPPNGGTICVRNADIYEYINYSGAADGRLTGLTRAKPGQIEVQLFITEGTNIGELDTVTNVQVGQRVIGDSVPEGTFVAKIDEENNLVYLSQAATLTNPIVTFAPMGSPAALTFDYQELRPTVVELAYPSFGPTISHWGTSVIMDGRFDDDKSLVFTYGQSSVVSLSGGQTRALFSIRIAPSVDNGVAANFGERDLLNRMQLVLKSLGVVTSSTNSLLLVRAILNGVPTQQVAWTNAVGNDVTVVNSSLSQISDFSSQNIGIVGGETIAGYFVQGSDTLNLEDVRDLGNSILGGGGQYSNSEIYPDGPDTLTVLVTNVSGTGVALLGRLSWTEAQA
jgi:hypothetical protein